MDDITIYTVEEIAQILRTTNSVVEVEIKNGKLRAFRIGVDWRITKDNLTDFIEKGGSQIGDSDRDAKLVKLQLKKLEAFQHKWPGGEIENYPDAFEGFVKNTQGNFEIKIGIGERYAAGQVRKRVVIFVNGRPTVEFVGTDGFVQSRLTVSLITLPNRKRLTNRQPVPSEYKNFTIAKYNSLVTGPHSMSTMAVVARIDDFDAMVTHALIRAGYRGE